MTDLQAYKALVLAFHNDLEKATEATVEQVLKRYASANYRWFGMHPFNELEGAPAVAASFWQPLLRSFTRLQRRQDIFMAGRNQLGGDHWVVSMGHFM